MTAPPRTSPLGVGLGLLLLAEAAWAATPVTLRYQFPPHTNWNVHSTGTISYQTRVVVGAHSKNPDPDTPPDLQYSSEALSTARVEPAENQQGAITWHVEKAQMTPTGLGIKAIPAPPDSRFLLDARGHGVPVTAPGSVGFQWLVDIPPLPADPVTVGSAWALQDSFSTGTYPVPVTIRCRATAQRKVDNQDALEVTYDVSGTETEHPTTSKTGVPMRATSTVTGHGVYLFAYGQGRLLQSDQTWRWVQVLHRVRADEGNTVTRTVDETAHVEVR